MKLQFLIISLFIALTAPMVNAGEPDYLALLAEESEIKAIAVVSHVQRMSRNSDGTFMRVSFKRKYAVTPYTPKKFVGGCKTMENNWQKRAQGTVYFKPRKGQTVYVTITTNGGAITSYTPINAQLDAVIRREPHRVAYSKGRANVIPKRDM
ncbi:hypothetical protein OAN24_04585 [Pseudodesulfovibrio sp.]|nr:hypothetical protein [Pseudodesulfovibrio sp.]